MKTRQLFGGLLLSLLLGLQAVCAEEEIYEGFHYVRLPTVVQPVQEMPGKLEVVELFWYGCGHCFTFEPHLHGWLQNKPADVEFVRVPAIFANPGWELLARAYYAAEALGILDQSHEALFSAIHRERAKLESEQQLARFFTRFGVDEKKFIATMKSFSVNTKVQRARQLTEAYGITGVPAVVVTGKYRSDGPMAQTYQGLLQVVDHLLDKERGQMSAGINQD